MSAKFPMGGEQDLFSLKSMRSHNAQINYLKNFTFRGMAIHVIYENSLNTFKPNKTFHSDSSFESGR